jgi:hypothetical protein
MMSAANPVSPKIIAAASGAGAGAILSSAAVWFLGAWLWRVGFSAENVDAAVAAVPLPLTAIVGLVFTVVGAAVPGYRTTDSIRNLGLQQQPLNVAEEDVADHSLQPAAATVEPEPEEVDDGDEVYNFA